jgi:hypothetical protein
MRDDIIVKNLLLFFRLIKFYVRKNNFNFKKGLFSY